MFQGDFMTLYALWVVKGVARRCKDDSDARFDGSQKQVFKTHFKKKKTQVVVAGRTENRWPTPKNSGECSRRRSGHKKKKRH